jgi:hypothetical protein
VAKQAAKVNDGTQTGKDTSGAEDSTRPQSRRDELNADFKQLAIDLRAANRASSKARKDRMEGLKRALRDILQAGDEADGEWH